MQIPPPVPADSPLPSLTLTDDLQLFLLPPQVAPGHPCEHRACHSCSRQGWGRAVAGWGGSPGSPMNLMAASRRGSCGLCRYGRARRRCSAARLLSCASCREWWQGRVGPGSAPLPATARAQPRPPLPATALRRGQQPLAPGSAGTQGRVCLGSRGAALPHSSAGPRLCGHPARAHRSLEKSPCGPCVQRWAGPQLPRAHSEHCAQGASPG